MRYYEDVQKKPWRDYYQETTRNEQYNMNERLKQKLNLDHDTVYEKFVNPQKKQGAYWKNTFLKPEEDAYKNIFPSIYAKIEMENQLASQQQSGLAEKMNLDQKARQFEIWQLTNQAEIEKAQRKSILHKKKYQEMLKQIQKPNDKINEIIDEISSKNLKKPKYALKLANIELPICEDINQQIITQIKKRRSTIISGNALNFDFNAYKERELKKKHKE